VKSASLADTVVRGWAKGPDGKIEILDSRNPRIPRGSVLLTTDGGKTARLYDAASKTCRAWPDRSSAGETESRPGVSVSVQSFRLDPSPGRPGEKVAGLSTTHYRFKISFDSTTTAMGTSLRSHIEKIEEFWTASGMQEPALRLWLNQNTPTTGDVAADRKIAEALEKVSGAILKRVTTASLTGDAFPKLETVTTLEVTKLERTPVPPARFAPPFACDPVRPPSR